MAEVEENFIIPQFREKTIYFTSEEQEFSYPVSSSYRGILRLSPNDSGTLREKNTLDLYNESDAIEMYYQDSLQDVIDHQFVKASTSDGFFVDFRLNDFHPEFDNLYVIGPAKFNKVRIFTTSDEALVVDRVTYFPAKVNTKYLAAAESDEDFNKDTTPIDCHDSRDTTYVLTSNGVSYRKFEYEQMSELVKKLIVEALIDLKTIPAGSIQYVPITVTEYNKLIIEGRPNRYYCEDGTSKTDPIVRDYLICDGSLYNNEDFPELAKVLNGEIITYWDLGPNGRMVKKIHKNDYGMGTKFRVPDLRRMFLKSVMLGQSNATTSNYDPNDNNQPWGRTGIWTTDARPMLEQDKTADNHRHYITTAYYQTSATLGQGTQFGRVATKIEPNEGEVQYYTYQLNVNNESTEGRPGVLAPKNNNAEWTWGKYGYSYNTNIYGMGCFDAEVDCNVCGYTLSIPQEYDFQKPTLNANLGLSSDEIISCVQTPTVKDDGEENVSYNDHTEYVQYADTAEAGTYGMENTPEFFCMLPLIKI